MDPEETRSSCGLEFEIHEWHFLLAIEVTSNESE
jgi:hypothetical protein